jgi:hypothetical protein
MRDLTLKCESVCSRLCVSSRNSIHFNNWEWRRTELIFLIGLLICFFS